MNFLDVLSVAGILFAWALLLACAAAVLVALGYWVGLIEDQQPDNDWGYGFDPDEWNDYMDRAEQESRERDVR